MSNKNKYKIESTSAVETSDPVELKTALPAEVATQPARQFKFRVTGWRMYDPYQQIFFEEGVDTAAEETSWVTCQIDAGYLARV